MRTLAIWIALPLPLLLNPVSAHAKINCSDNVKKLVGIWGKTAEAAALTSINQGDTTFKVITPGAGIASVSEKVIGKSRIPVIHHTKGGKRNVSFSLNPNNNCGIGLITFYSYSPKGIESKVTVTGDDCYHFSDYSAEQSKSHGDEYSHSEEDNKAVKAEIVRSLAAKNPPVRASEPLIQRIRDNCRNSTVVGNLSFDSRGRNNASWQEYVRKIQNESESALDPLVPPKP